MLDYSNLLSLLVSEIELLGAFDKVHRQKIVDLQENQKSSLCVLLMKSDVSRRMLGNPFDCKTPVRFIVKARCAGVDVNPDELIDGFIKYVCSVVVNSEKLKSSGFESGASDVLISWNPLDIFDIDETVSVVEIIAEFRHRLSSDSFSL